MLGARRLIPIVVSILLFSTGCATAPPATKERVDHPRLWDGVYEGTGSSVPVNVRVRVLIEDQRISNIELIEDNSLQGKGAGVIIPDRILQEQSTEVNGVSGATRSSRAIMKAVRNALDKAKQK